MVAGLRRSGTLALLTIVCGCTSHGGHGSAPPPSIDAVVPDSGPRTGGNPVHVQGHGFGAHPFVTFGLTAVQTLTSTSDTEIVFDAPPDQVGIANVTVVADGGGEATKLAAYFYLPLDARTYAGRFFAGATDAAHANPVVVGTAGTISGLDVELPAETTGAIAGTLTSGGAPLTGHAVRARRVDGAFPDVPALAGVDGGWKIGGLAPGDWLVLSAEEQDSPLADLAFPGVADPALATPVTVVAGATAAGTDLDLPPGGSIDGVISGAGVPLEGVTVYAVSAAGDPLQFRYATTGSGGAFTLPGLAPGSYRLLSFAFGTGFVNEYWPGALDAASAGTIDVLEGLAADGSMDLDVAGSFSGQVLESPELAPLPQVELIAHDVDRGLSYFSATGVDGSWLLPGLPAGRYRVEAPEIGKFYPGVTGTSGATIVTLSAGQAIANVSLSGRLGETPCTTPGTGAASGIVSGPAGQKVLRATALLASTSGGATAAAVSGLDGAWTADCLAPGAYSVSIVPAGTNLVRADAPAIVVLPSMTTGGADVSLRRGPSIAGQVRDDSHHPLAEALVLVSNAATGEHRTTATGADGRWSVDRASQGGLRPGSWTIEIRSSVQLDSPP